jgi:phosphonate transport system substrate-binding protein
MRRREVLLQLGAAWALALPTASTRAGNPPLRVGLTAVILSDQAAFLKHWADYLSQRMESRVTFVARESYQAVLDLLFSGQLDAAWICGYPYVRHQAQLRLLAVPMFHGSPRYQSYLIRTKGSPLRGWQDLRGQVLAYSDPLSNSGWLVPQVQLRLAGLSARDLRRSFFAHGHRNVAEAVATGLAQAGCIDGYVWETMQAHGMASVMNTEVIWKSVEYGFPPIVARVRDTRPALQALGIALMRMPEVVAGSNLLKALNLTGFTVATPSMFDSIRELAMNLNNSLS